MDGCKELVEEIVQYLGNGVVPKEKVKASSLSPNVAQLILIHDEREEDDDNGWYYPPEIFVVERHTNDDGTVSIGVKTNMKEFSRECLLKGFAFDSDDDDTEIGESKKMEQMCVYAAENVHKLCVNSDIVVPCKSKEFNSKEMMQNVLIRSVELELLLRRVIDAQSTDNSASYPLLRDLLACDAVRNALGMDFIFLATLICGLPCGINLRNVAWHGFLSPHELHGSLEAILNSLLGCVRHWLEAKQSIAHIPLSSDLLIIPHAPDLEVFSSLIKDYSMDKSFEVTIRELVHDSLFVFRDREDFVSSLLIDMVQSRRPEHIVLFLPQIEHCLRRLFVSVNKLPSMIMSPDFHRYYTTMEIILQATIIKHGDQLLARSAAAGTRFQRPKFASDSSFHDETDFECPNRLADVVGSGTMMLLHDCLTHGTGPRLRDKIAHGMVSLVDLPSEFIDALICAFLYLCVKFCGHSNTVHMNRWKRCVDIVDQHVSCFHPSHMSLCTMARAIKVTIETAILNENTNELLHKDESMEEYASHIDDDDEGNIISKDEAKILIDRCEQQGCFLYGQQQHINVAQQLSRICDCVATLYNSIRERIESLIVSVYDKTATRRAQTNCYNAVAYVHAFQRACQHICKSSLELFSCVDSQKNFKTLMKSLTRCEESLSRAPALCTAGSWTELAKLLNGASNQIQTLITSQH